MNFEETLNARREAIAKSIRPVGTDEVIAMGDRLFPLHDDPWREKFFDFLAENPHATFHHAEFPEEGQLLYSRSHERGIWFIPGKAMGIMQPNGLKMLAEILSGGA